MIWRGGGRVTQGLGSMLLRWEWQDVDVESREKVKECLLKQRQETCDHFFLASRFPNKIYLFIWKQSDLCELPCGWQEPRHMGLHLLPSQHISRKPYLQQSSWGSNQNSNIRCPSSNLTHHAIIPTPFFYFTSVVLIHGQLSVCHHVCQDVSS